jgi:hypothetical protein
VTSDDPGRINGHLSPIGDKRVFMDEREARDCVESIRRGVESIRRLIFDLYSRRGWQALGYATWAACVTAEFNQSRGYLYRQLQAAFIESEINPQGEIGTIPESVVRPLARLPEGERAEVYHAAVASAPDGRPTAAAVQRIVTSVRVSPGAADQSTRPVFSVHRVIPKPSLRTIDDAEWLATRGEDGPPGPGSESRPFAINDYWYRIEYHPKAPRDERAAGAVAVLAARGPGVYLLSRSSLRGRHAVGPGVS